MIRTALLSSALAAAVLGYPAASYTGVSSVRKSINFGPSHPATHHSLANPSLQLVAFNAAASVTLTTDCASHLDPALCAGEAIAQSFIRSLHPSLEFKLVNSYISSHNQVHHSHYVQLHHGLVVANANLNVNVDLLNARIVSCGDNSHSSSADVIHQTADYVLNQAHQVIFTDNAPQSATPHDDFAPPGFHLKPNDPRHALLSFLAQQSDSSDLALLLPSITARRDLHNSMQINRESTTALRIHNAPTTHEPVPATLVYILDENKDLKLSWKLEVRTENNEYEAYVQADAAVTGEEQVYMTVDWVRDFRPTQGEVGVEGLITVSRETRPRSSNFNINAVVQEEHSFVTAAPTNSSVKPSYKVFPWGVYVLPFSLPFVPR